MKYPLFLACLIGAALIVSNARAQAPPVAGVGWSRLSDLPRPLSGRFAGVSNSALIIAGGSAFPVSPYAGGQKIFSDQIDVLESVGGGWQTGGKLERPLAQGSSVTTDHGVICLGGGDADRSYASVRRLRWDGTRIKSDRLPDLPSPCAFSGAAQIGGVVYVAGGIAAPTATEALHTFWRIDLNQKAPRWESLPPWPGPGLLGAVVVAHGDSIYVISGASIHPAGDGKPARAYRETSWRYRIGKGWKQIADTPGPVVAAPAIFSDGKISVFGGDSGADAARAAVLRDRHPGFRRDTLTYSPVSDRWTSQPNAIPIGLVTTTAVLWNDRIVIAGGEDRPGHRSTAVLAQRAAASNREEKMTTIQPTQVPLFVAGEGGYHTYRIPSLIATKHGSLLAFAEGRRDGAGDAGAVDLVVRRSYDGGKTWDPTKVVWADGTNTCGNPCPAVDQSTGAICLLVTHNLGQDHEKDIITATSVGSRTVWILRSSDDGVTWTHPSDITATTKKPDWGWYATGAGRRYPDQERPAQGAPRHPLRSLGKCDAAVALTCNLFRRRRPDVEMWRRQSTGSHQRITDRRGGERPPCVKHAQRGSGAQAARRLYERRRRRNLDGFPLR